MANYSAAGLPLEVVWSDIEYMPKFWTMEFDPGDSTPCLCIHGLHKQQQFCSLGTETKMPCDVWLSDCPMVVGLSQ